MGKAVSSVTKAIGGVVGSITGSPDQAGLLGTGGQFKGQTRTIDKDAFKIGRGGAYEDQANKAQNQAQGRQQEAYGQRQTLVSQLQGQADGTAPSLAEAQLKAAGDRSLAQQIAAAQANPASGNRAAMARQLMQSQAAQGQQNAQDATAARLQERQMAQQQLGQITGEDQQAFNNMQAQYMQQGFNMEQAAQKALQDYEAMQTQQFLSAQGLSAQGFEGAKDRQVQTVQGIGQAIGMLSDKNQKKNIKKENSFTMDLKGKTSAEVQEDEENKGLDSKSEDPMTAGLKGRTESEVEKDDNDKAKKQQQISAIFSQPKKKTDTSASRELFAKTLAEVSDENQKKATQEKNPKSFLDALTAYSYEYKNPKAPGAGEGRHYSVMAQDLEKAGPIGKGMVTESPEGHKMVDYGKGFGAMLAAQASLNKRLNQLEKKKRG